MNTLMTLITLMTLPMVLIGTLALILRIALFVAWKFETRKIKGL